MISIVLEETLELNHFPRNIAIELLATIPQIEPQIRGILNKGYCTPNPSEDKKVLSPNSPIAILEATINTQLRVKEVMNLIIFDLESVSVVFPTESAFFNLIKPIIPKNKNVQ